MRYVFVKYMHQCAFSNGLLGLICPRGQESKSPTGLCGVERLGDESSLCVQVMERVDGICRRMQPMPIEENARSEEEKEEGQTAGCNPDVLVNLVVPHVLACFGLVE